MNEYIARDGTKYSFQQSADLSSWQPYAEAFEAYCDVKRDKLPTRAEFGL